MPDENLERDNNPNSSLIMSSSSFEKQMEFLTNNYEVVPIDDLIGHLKGDSKKFVVTVTFDDGYKDNLVHALPIIENYKIPIIIYITTRFPEGDTWMWWYEIWDYLKKVEKLEVNNLTGHEEWEVNTMKNKIQCFNKLKNLIMKLDGKGQEEMVENLTKTSNRKQYPHLCLNWDEIKRLDQHPLVSIGSHSHSHYNLKLLTNEDAYREMSISKALLEKYLGHPIEHFAYPFGTADEADTREFKLAYRCGFSDAVTTRPEKIESPSLHNIPRLGVPNYMTIQGFKGKLSGWEQLIRKSLLGKRDF